MDRAKGFFFSMLDRRRVVFMRARITALPLMSLAALAMFFFSRGELTPGRAAPARPRLEARVFLPAISFRRSYVDGGPAVVQGRVWDNANAPLPGVTITAGEGITTTTDANGAYTFHLAAGTYTLAPSWFQKPFVPSSLQISVSAGVNSGLDFTCLDCIVDVQQRVWVPAGNFRMGCALRDMYCDGDERPLHTVSLSAFSMDRYEVTNGRYSACVFAGGCTAPYAPGSATHASYYGNPAFADFPVVNVDWSQAQAFCQWDGGRLPTEAEWEKVARGGTDQRVYPWGEEAADCPLANFYARGSYCVGDTAPAGSFPLGDSPYQVSDLAGSVWEWVSDWYLPDFYTSAAEWIDPPGPALGMGRVQRGGGWGDSFFSLRVSNRRASEPSAWQAEVGFRCAR
jgi:formylglycine-generating enzyme required for sulfatase activity